MVSPLKKETINRILNSEERFPIILQAIGKEEAFDKPITFSLINIGEIILSGLTVGMKNMLIDLAHNRGSIRDDLPLK